MGAQTTQLSAGSSASRRAKPFIMDDQARFLYLILKQLDLKTINWQQVADDLGIKNGHAARMRWSRFRSHVEGVPATNNKKKDERKGKSVNTKTHMATKRVGIESGQDEENDAKRVKIEQGWASIPGGYGQPPPPPYYPVDPSYGMVPPHHPSFGTVQLPHFGFQPHGPGRFQPPPQSQSVGPALPPPGTLNPDNMINSSASILVKPDPGSPLAPQPSTDPRDEPSTVLFKSERDREVLEQSGSATSSSTASIESLQPNQTQKSEMTSALTSAVASVGPSATRDDANCMAPNDGQQSVATQVSDPTRSGTRLQNQEVKSEQESVDGVLPEAPPLVAEVSKQDFTKAIDAEAAAHAQEVTPIIESQTTTSPRQGDPSSPEIPLATVKAQALRQQTASMETPSSAQVQLVSSGAVARAGSRWPPSCETQPPSKPQPSTPANLSGRQSPPSTYAVSMPAKSVSPKASAPPLLTAPITVAHHPFTPHYALPSGSYFHPHFPNHQTHHPMSHTYWHHPPIALMNNSPPSPYPHPHPPMSAPPTIIPDWNDSPYPFGHPAFQPAVALHEYGQHAMSAPASQTNFNFGGLIPTSQIGTGQEEDQSAPATGIDMTNTGFKMTSDANMDILVPSIDEFDPLGFDFRLGKDTRTGMGLRVENGPMEPQYVLPSCDESGSVEPDGHGGGNEKEKDGEVG